MDILSYAHMPLFLLFKVKMNMKTQNFLDSGWALPQKNIKWKIVLVVSEKNIFFNSKHNFSGNPKPILKMKWHYIEVENTFH